MPFDALLDARSCAKYRPGSKNGCSRNSRSDESRLSNAIAKSPSVPNTHPMTKPREYLRTYKCTRIFYAARDVVQQLCYDIVMTNTDSRALATFGAGCFWGVEDVFMQVPGVLETAVGYMGGTLEEPTYEMVCTDSTGHAEVVQIAYDPSIVSYDQLLNVFWENHNPTTMNRQGPDIGSQYRSVIFYHSDEQKHAAEQSLKQLDASGTWKSPVITAIEPAQTFWRAEDYHQKYHLKNGGSCHI